MPHVTEPRYKDTYELAGLHVLRPGTPLQYPPGWALGSSDLRALVTKTGLCKIKNTPARPYVVDFSSALEHFLCDGQAYKFDPAPAGAKASYIEAPAVKAVLVKLGAEVPEQDAPMTPEEILLGSQRESLARDGQAAPAIAGLATPTSDEAEAAAAQELEDDEPDVIDRKREKLEQLKRASAILGESLERIEELKESGQAKEFVAPEWMKKLQKAHDEQALKLVNAPDEPPTGAGTSSEPAHNDNTDKQDAGEVALSPVPVGTSPDGNEDAGNGEQGATA